NENRCKNNDDIDREKFKNIVGVDFDDMMKLDLPNKTDKAKKYEEINNKSYYYLYNDLLMRDFDCLLKDGINDEFFEVYKSLSEVEDNKYSYIFKNLANLAKALSVKAELSKKIYLA